MKKEIFQEYLVKPGSMSVVELRGLPMEVELELDDP